MNGYNSFMKDEIALIKYENPNIAHENAFREPRRRWNAVESNIINSENQYTETNNFNSQNGYNSFIKDEVELIKHQYPGISHREAIMEARHRWRNNNI